jgi:hypothetical protein
VVGGVAIMAEGAMEGATEADGGGDEEGALEVVVRGGTTITATGTGRKATEGVVVREGAGGRRPTEQLHQRRPQTRTYQSRQARGLVQHSPDLSCGTQEEQDRIRVGGE